jgi:hypothetical protein
MSHVVHHELQGNFVSRYLYSAISEYLPRRMKRLFYVGSLVPLIFSDDTPELSWLERLNKKLRLASGATGLLPPIYFSGRIWNGINLDHIPLENREVRKEDLKDTKLSEKDCWKLGLYLTRRCPSWIRYGSEELMTTDAHDFLRQCPQARSSDIVGAL